MSRYCKNCGKELKITDVKCPNCGVDLNTDAKEEEKKVEATPFGLAVFSLLLFTLTITVNYLITRSMETGGAKTAINVFSFMVFLTGASLYKEARKKVDTPFMRAIPIIGFIIIAISCFLIFFKQ